MPARARGWSYLGVSDHSQSGAEDEIEIAIHLDVCGPGRRGRRRCGLLVIGRIGHVLEAARRVLREQPHACGSG